MTRLSTFIFGLLLVSLDVLSLQDMSKMQRRWSREEDASLREQTDLQLAGTLLDQHGKIRPCAVNIAVVPQANAGRIKDWTEIAKKIPARNKKDCRKRFIIKVQGGLKKASLRSDPGFLLSSHSSVRAFLLRVYGRK